MLNDSNAEVNAEFYLYFSIQHSSDSAVGRGSASSYWRLKTNVCGFWPPSPLMTASSDPSGRFV